MAGLARATITIAHVMAITAAGAFAGGAAHAMIYIHDTDTPNITEHAVHELAATEELRKCIYRIYMKNLFTTWPVVYAHMRATVVACSS